MSDEVLRAAERTAFATQEPSDIAIYWALALRAGQLPKHTLNVEAHRPVYIWTLFPNRYDVFAYWKKCPSRVIDFREWNIQRGHAHSFAGNHEDDFIYHIHDTLTTQETADIDHVKIWLTELLVRFEEGLDV